MRGLSCALALASLSLGAAASAPTVVDLGGYPSPIRLQADGGAAQDQAAGAVLVAELNGDGIDDLVVAARYADPHGRTNAGKVFVVYGSASAQGTVFLTGNYAGPTLCGAAALDQFGETLAVGDFDGDGRDDLAVGASWVDAAGRVDSGAVYLFFGSGASFPSIDLATQSASVTVLGAQANQRAGTAVALGDLNGDGRDELIVGSPRAGPAGRVYVVPGAGAPSPLIDLAANGTSSVIEGVLPGGELGAALGVGEANGDHKDDLFAGAPSASPAGRAGAGVAYLVLGRSPLAANLSIDQAAAVTILGAAANDAFGSAVAMGDLNGDRRDDLVTGAVNASPAGLTGAGAAYAVLMPGAVPTVVDLSSSAPAVVIAGADAYDKLGATVGVADLDRDGNADFVAGAPNGDPPGRPQAGVLVAVSGTRANARHPARVSAPPDLVLYGASSSDRAATGLALGDFTDDSIIDVIVGAPRADGALGLDAGSAYVVPGPFQLLPLPVTPTPTATATPKRRYLPLLTHDRGVSRR